MYVLNIGLKIKKSNKKNSYMKTLYFIMKNIPLFNKIKINRSLDDTLEDTVIIYYFSPILPSLIRRLCFNLKQDCIAIYNIEESTGVLIGPNRRFLWGEFNKLKFIL